MRAPEVAEAVAAFGQHEHRELAHGLARVHALGLEIRAMARIDGLRALHVVWRWWNTTMEPHLAWEASWLYPHIHRGAGTPWATRAAHADHSRLRALALRLHQAEAVGAAAWSPDFAAEAAASLFALEALATAHLEHEERLLLPVLIEQVTQAGEAVGPAVA